MVKLRNPLFSLMAHGKLGDISFLRRGTSDIAEKTPEVPNQKTPAQLSWRNMYQKCALLWHTLSIAEKQEWESLGTARHMTGFAYWQSQCLRPNPGIYLPLQGGTMQGNIDMAEFRLLKLPLPADSQEPASKAYHDEVANLPIHGASKHTNISKTILFSAPPCVSGFYSYAYIAFPDGVTTESFFNIIVPPDFVSFTRLDVAWGGHEGEVAQSWRMGVTCYYSAAGEALNTHLDGPADQNISVPALHAQVHTNSNCLFTSLALGDIIGVSIARIGAHAQDTYTGQVRLLTFAFTYMASQ